jgi:hypothetical protein
LRNEIQTSKNMDAMLVVLNPPNWLVLGVTVKYLLCLKIIGVFHLANILKTSCFVGQTWFMRTRRREIW